MYLLEEFPLVCYPTRKRTGNILTYCLSCQEKHGNSVDAVLLIDGAEFRFCKSCRKFHPTEKFSQLKKTSVLNNTYYKKTCKDCDVLETTKFCTKCSQEKSLDDFYKKPNGYPTSYCKSCMCSKVEFGNKKKCKKCNTIKSLDSFYKTNVSWMSTCIDCTTTISRIADQNGMRLCRNKQWHPVSDFIISSDKKVTRFCKICSN